MTKKVSGSNILFTEMDFESLRIIVPKKTNSWRVPDVEKWLRFIHLDQYILNFRALAIDGSNLKNLNEEDLREELQVTSRIIIKKLLSWIPSGLQAFDSYLEEAVIEEETSDEEYEPMVETQPNTCGITLGEMKSTAKREKAHELILRRLDINEVNFYHRFVQTNFRIGCHANCEVQVEDEQVEKYHTKIAYRHPHFYLRNLSLDSGTYLKVRGRVLLCHMQRIEMGSHVFRVSLHQENSLVVLIIGGTRIGQKFEFPTSKPRISIGRKSTCDINLGGDSTLSNMHAKILFIEKDWFLEDLGTTNGTWVQLETETVVENGVVFKLGCSNFQYECEVKESTSEELKAAVKKELQLEKDSCRICRVKEKNILYQPCNHVISCESCSKLSEKCIVCFGKIRDKIKIFKV